MVIVLSAMSGETNRLIALAKEISPNPSPRELDVVISTGEQVTIGLLCMALEEMGVKARSYTGGQVRILTDDSFTKARILDIDGDNIRRDLDAGAVVVVAGFQGVDEELATSPPSAVAAPTPLALRWLRRSRPTSARSTPTWMVFTPPTRVVPEARKLDTITFEEMLEMASLGSKVLQIRSVEFAGKYKVKLRVLSSFQEEGEGTLITVEEDKNMEQPIISGIAFNRDEAKITVLGVPDKPGIAYQILGPVADANVDVDMIIQNVGHDGTTDFSFTVNRPDYDKAMKILEGVQSHIGARRNPRRPHDGQGFHRRRRHALPPGRRLPHVPHPGRRRHQHPDDLHFRDQDFRRHRREIPGTGRSRAAPRFRPRSGLKNNLT
jgi:aspartate kinase